MLYEEKRMDSFLPYKINTLKIFSAIILRRQTNYYLLLAVVFFYLYYL